jgi:polar amino acid transport system substrate-binding protein
MFALLALVWTLNGSAGAAPPAVLAPTGTLRAAYIVANVARQGSTPAGAITGVVADITRGWGAARACR